MKTTIKIVRFSFRFHIDEAHTQMKNQTNEERKKSSQLEHRVLKSCRIKMKEPDLYVVANTTDRFRFFSACNVKTAATNILL